MKWTTKIPEKPGYYWFYDDDLKVTEMVKVEPYNDTWYVSNDEYGFYMRDIRVGKDKWCFVPKPK